MKLKIDRQLLTAQLAHISKALPTKSPLTILLGIKIVVTPVGVFLTSSDSDITINTFLPLEVKGTQVIKIEEVGSIVIPGKYFIEIIRKLTGETIEITTFEGNFMMIKCGQSEYTLNGFDEMDYPNIELIKTGEPLRIEKQLLKSVVRQTSFSVGSGENRPVLTGINFRYEDNVLTCTATDSFRLSKKVIDLESDHVPFNIVIPGRSLNELAKILDDSAEAVDIHISNNQVLFQSGFVAFQSRLLDGIYPEVREFVPTTFGIEIKVKYHDLLEALDRTALIARDQVSNVMKLNFLPQTSKLLMTAQAPEVGKVEEDVNIEFLTGGELHISCSVVYMIDAIKALNSSDVIIGLNGDMKPFVLRNEKDDTTIQLIVPVRME